MLHPTRTNLLQLKEKQGSINNSIRILKARRQALVKEFIDSSRRFMKDRRKIRELYRRAIGELAQSRSIEDHGFLASIAAVSRRNPQLTLKRHNLMGVPYYDVTVQDSIIRALEERPYDFWDTTQHFEDTIFDFERVAEAVLELAIFESKLKRLGEEINRVSRRTRVLEDRLLPRIDKDIRTISQYLGERERESYYRLKRFKDMHSGK
ncbi:MAG TPA: V-type ATP synthase subunit D [Desulfuromonadales bacterium]|nr:V-type ATP synthase subunit D [Desulfuromonadales bacterium]